MHFPHAEARGLLRSARVVRPSSELSITSSIHGTTSNSIARLLGNRPAPSSDASHERQLALRHNKGRDQDAVSCSIAQARTDRSTPKHKSIRVFQPAICCTERFTSAISCESLPRHGSSFKFFKLRKPIVLAQVVILSCDSLIVATSLWTLRDVCSVLLHMHSQASCDNKFRSSLSFNRHPSTRHCRH